MGQETGCGKRHQFLQLKLQEWVKFSFAIVRHDCILADVAVSGSWLRPWFLTCLFPMQSARGHPRTTMISLMSLLGTAVYMSSKLPISSSLRGSLWKVALSSVLTKTEAITYYMLRKGLCQKVDDSNNPSHIVYSHPCSSSSASLLPPLHQQHRHEPDLETVSAEIRISPCVSVCWWLSVRLKAHQNSILEKNLQDYSPVSWLTLPFLCFGPKAQHCSPKSQTLLQQNSKET